MVQSVTNSVFFAGKPIAAQNDEAYLDAPRAPKELLFEFLDLAPGKTIKQLIDHVQTGKDDGRDRIIVQVRTPSGPRYAQIFADRIQGITRDKNGFLNQIGLELTVKGQPATILAVRVSRDGTARFDAVATMGVGVVGGAVVGLPYLWVARTATSWVGKFIGNTVALSAVAVGGATVIAGAYQLIKRNDQDKKPPTLLTGLAVPAPNTKL